MDNFYKLFLIPAALLLLVGCDTNNLNVGEPNEYLVSDSFVREITADQLTAFWQFIGVPEVQDFLDYDVRVYRIVYNTIDGNGNPIEASGAILVPNGIDNPGLLSVQHATIFSNDEAPSVDRNNPIQGIVSSTTRKAIFASAGYITFLPDYIGYGITNNQLHPYQQEQTLATASRDMVLAGLEFVAENDLADINQPVDMIGYSEGAYATLALAKLIENGPPIINIGQITMGAPIFDLTGTMDYIINNIDDQFECVSCYAYFLYTYHQIYDLPRPLGDYFNEPYASIIEDGLFSGENTSAFVRNQLPENLVELFTEEFIDRYLNNQEPELLAAVGENDIFYIPQAPVLLVHGDADGVAPIFNSDDFEARAMNQGKTNFTYIRPQGVTHGGGFVPWGLETMQLLTGQGKLLVKN